MLYSNYVATWVSFVGWFQWKVPEVGYGWHINVLYFEKRGWKQLCNPISSINVEEEKNLRKVL